MAPAVGTCWAHDVNYPIVDAPTDCASTHYRETFFVGTFDRNADGIANPLTAAARPACMREAGAYLGSPDWVATRMWINWSEPRADQLRAGANWFRCDIVVYSTHQSPAVVIDRQGSVRGALAGDGMLAWRSCYAASSEVSVPCTEPHVEEAMGPSVDAGTAFADWPGDDAYRDFMDDTCASIGKAYVGANRNDVQWGWSQLTQDEWDSGDRTELCFADTENPVVGTVQGIGYGSLPTA